MPRWRRAAGSTKASPCASFPITHDHSLKPGDPAPDFTAKTTDSKTVSLKDFRGKKLVMYFYPMDDTPGCTKQACSLRDHNHDIVAKGAAILGVSTQDEASHRKFTEKYKW